MTETKKARDLNWDDLGYVMDILGWVGPARLIKSVTHVGQSVIVRDVAGEDVGLTPETYVVLTDPARVLTGEGI
jgi:hypothetical protein